MIALCFTQVTHESFWVLPGLTCILKVKVIKEKGGVLVDYWPVYTGDIMLQWNLRVKDTLGPIIVSIVKRMS